MADTTGIVWTDATWNPVTGCTKVSAGCKHCYAERDWARLSANPKTRYHGREFTDVQCHGDLLDQPLRWTKPRRIFVNSMSDLFHEAVPDRFIADVFGIMAAAPHHTFQVLTKRPERMRKLLGAGCMGRFEADVEEAAALYTDQWPLEWPLKNVWIGVTVEDQAAANERIPLLIETPAAVRWLSMEPLIESVTVFSMDGPVDVWPGMKSPIDWIVVAGESGPKARPMHPAWARSIRDQCAETGVPFLFKQWGEWAPRDEWQLLCHNRQIAIMPDGSEVDHDTTPQDVGGHRLERVGKKAAGRLLDGVLHDAYPEVAQ